MRKEPLLIPNYDPIEVTIIDCANPVVLLRAADLGLEGTELTELNDNAKLMEHIEAIRGMAAEKLGFVSDWKTAKNISTSIPKVSILSSPRSYRNMSGNWTQKEDMDLCVRAVSLGMIHKAIPLTVATATGAAACMEGTIISDIVAGTAGKKAIFLGHASGVTAVQVELEGDKVKKAGIIRTARRIMDGYIYINN